MFSWSKILQLLSLAGLLVACQGQAAPPTQPPPLVHTPPPTTAHDDLQRLQQAAVPVRDLRDLTQRYKNIETPRILTRPLDQVGDTATFWVKIDETNQPIEAQLVYQADSLNLWVEQGQRARSRDLQAAATELERHILPTNRAFFGTESQPGIDGDERLHILHLKSLGGGTVGYFSSADNFAQAINPFSNERDILYVALDHAPLGSEAYYQVLAHEYQHLIHWHVDSNETTWVNEGMAELAATLNQYAPSDHIGSFLTQPDTSLTHFEYESADYGAAYLFVTYVYDRLGDEFVRAWVQHPDNGLAGLEAVLQAHQAAVTVSELFADWVVTNYAASHNLGQPPYQYTTLADLPVSIEPQSLQTGLEQIVAVEQYGTDYWHLQGTAPVTLVFTGTQQTRLLDTTPHSGDHLWSTVPADASAQSLTRAFDLSATEGPTATLSFWTWYDIELGWDYAYASVSADGGDHWTPLETIATSRANPHGNNLGTGYTGMSGSVEPPIWQEQTADLSPYIEAGDILIRFAYITDDAVTNQGLAIDDIAIPEIGFFDDVEGGENGWQAAGFVRHANQLPQSFLVQLITVQADGAVRVEPLALDQQRGRWVIPLDAQTREAVVAISATTPVTSLPASYLYRLLE